MQQPTVPVFPCNASPVWCGSPVLNVGDLTFYATGTEGEPGWDRDLGTRNCPIVSSTCDTVAVDGFACRTSPVARGPNTSSHSAMVSSSVGTILIASELSSVVFPFLFRCYRIGGCSRLQTAQPAAHVSFE